MQTSTTFYLGLLILATIGNVAFISKFLKQPWKISLFILVNIYILVLYYFSLIKKLDYGVYLILIIGIILFTNLLKNINKTEKINLKNFLWLFPFIIFIRAVPKDYKFTMFDEFNSWAVNIKWLVAERALGDINSATRLISEGFNQSYPPAQELFQFLIINNMDWSEANVLISQIIFILICLMAINNSYTIKSSYLIFISYTASIILFYIFGLTFNNILADNLLAAHFATCLALSIKSELSNKSLLSIGLSTSVLCLIKPISFLFTFLIFTIVILRICIDICSNSLSHNKKSSFIKIILLRIILLIAPTIVSLASWNFHVKMIGIDTSIKFINFFESMSNGTAMQIVHTYIQTFFGPLFGKDNLAGVSSNVPHIIKILHISLASIFVTLCIFQFLLILLKPEHTRLELKKIFIAIIFFALMYQIALLYLYISFFGEVAALTRYTVPLFYAWFLTLFYLIIEEFDRFKYKNTLIPVGLILLYVSAPSILKSDLFIIKSDPVKLEKRIEVENLAFSTKRIVNDKDRVYFLYQNSDNFEKFIFSYAMLPIGSNDHCSSIGIRYSTYDRWTCNVDLGNVLREYNYLIVGNGDEIFWRSNSVYLTKGSYPKQAGIFRIKYINNKLILENIDSA